MFPDFCFMKFGYPTDFCGLPRWCSGKKSACQCRRRKRREFHHCVRKFPWRRKWQPTPLFFSGKSYGQRSLVGLSVGSQRVRNVWATEQRHPPIQTSVMENFQAFFLSYNSGSGKAFRVLLQTWVRFLCSNCSNKLTVQLCCLDYWNIILYHLPDC